MPLHLPSESAEKWARHNPQGVPAELGILLGGFCKSEAVQLRVDFDRLHAAMIPLPVPGTLKGLFEQRRDVDKMLVWKPLRPSRAAPLRVRHTLSVDQLQCELDLAHGRAEL